LQLLSPLLGRWKFCFFYIEINFLKLSGFCLEIRFLIVLIFLSFYFSAKVGKDKEKRKTIDFAGKDYGFLFENENSSQRRLSYCDRKKIKSKFNVWKKLMQIRR